MVPPSSRVGGTINHIIPEILNRDGPGYQHDGRKRKHGGERLCQYESNSCCDDINVIQAISFPTMTSYIHGDKAEWNRQSRM